MFNFRAKVLTLFLFYFENEKQYLEIRLLNFKEVSKRK